MHLAFTLLVAVAAKTQVATDSRLPDWPIWVWGLLAVSLLFVGYLVSAVLKYFIWIAIGGAVFLFAAPTLLGDQGQRIQDRVMSTVHLSEIKDCSSAFSQVGTKKGVDHLTKCGTTDLIQKGVKKDTTIRTP